MLLYKRPSFFPILRNQEHTKKWSTRLNKSDQFHVNIIFGNCINDLAFYRVLNTRKIDKLAIKS